MKILPTRLSCSLLVAAAIALLTHFAPSASALSFETVGPAKGPGADIQQPGWAHGVVPIRKHKSCAYIRETNGHELVHFQADQEQIAQLVKLYSEIRLRDHVILVEKGTPVVESFKGEEFAFNVRFEMLGGLMRGHLQNKGDKEGVEPEATTYEPTLTIYVADDAGMAALEKMKWPTGTIIQHKLEGSELKGDREQPKRQNWHAAVNFDDGKPAVDFESGIQTTVTLWEKGNDIGIDLGKVNYKGKFEVAFSDAEMERLKKEELWLTMTPGNFLTKATPEHPRLKIDSFGLDPEKVTPATVAKSGISQLYYGRLEFEDGKPTVMDPEPWSGAEIGVNFPYAGQVRPDENGDFQVTLTEEQFKALKARRVRKNIYIPLYGTNGQSRALHAFPAEKLSKDKEKPGVVAIPRPLPPCRDF